jgi:hypothetical protein
MATHETVTDQEQTSVSTDRFAVYDPEGDRICHTETGAAISDSRDAAAEMVAAVADHMGLSADRLTVVRVTITPLDGATEAIDGAAGDTEYTTGSIMVNRGPHRQHSQIVEYREAEDGAWAIKTSSRQSARNGMPPTAIPMPSRIAAVRPAICDGPPSQGLSGIQNRVTVGQYFHRSLRVRRPPVSVPATRPAPGRLCGS